MYQQYREGWIEVICGCMFAGKSEELIRRIHVLSYAKKEIQIFKPQIDDRYAKNEVVAHNGARIPCTAVKDSKELASKIAKTTEVVAVDEVQFFDEGMIGLCEQLASQGRRVMLVGLDLDYRGEPFGIMPQLIAKAEFVTKLTAVCSCCGAPATRTQLLIKDESAVHGNAGTIIGGSESYEARCRHCHTAIQGRKQ